MFSVFVPQHKHMLNKESEQSIKLSLAHFKLSEQRNLVYLTGNPIANVLKKLYLR